MLELFNRINERLTNWLMPAQPTYWETKYELHICDHCMRNYQVQKFASLKDAMEVVEVQELMYDNSKRVHLTSIDYLGNTHILRITNRKEDVPEMQFDL